MPYKTQGASLLVICLTVHYAKNNQQRIRKLLIPYITPVSRHKQV